MSIRSGAPATRAPAPGLIITADDFGLHASVNRAVQQAHREGVLAAASLMVGSPAARDAVARAGAKAEFACAKG